MNYIDVDWVYFFNIDQDIIWVDNDKNVQIFAKDFVNISLETCLSIRQTNRYYLVLKIAISGTKPGLLFITFFDPYPMINTGQV